MFTGLVQAVGTLQRIPRGVRVRIDPESASWDGAGPALGDSMAIDGVCLTVAEGFSDGFRADISEETLGRSTLAEKADAGAAVNVEPALRLSDRLGGHLVSGHVDGVGEIVAREADGRSVRFHVRAPDALARYVAAKGSICVDGISLTVNAVEGAGFTLNIVPHTLAGTTLADAHPGRRVNLEVDLVARYLERLLQGEQAAVPVASRMTPEWLAAQGLAARH